MTDHRTQLLEQGYCIIPNVLGEQFIAKLRDATDILIDAMSPQERAEQR